MQKQAREKPSARVARRKQRSSDAPLQTSWRRCVSLVLKQDFKDPNLSLRPDPQTMAASMQSTYSKAFKKTPMTSTTLKTTEANEANKQDKSKKRKLPDWLLAPEKEEDKSCLMDQNVQHEKGLELYSPAQEICDFCQEQREVETYGEDTFEAMRLCEECAQSERVDVDGTTHKAIL
jgi:hypothetical protein